MYSDKWMLHFEMYRMCAYNILTGIMKEIMHSESDFKWYYYIHSFDGQPLHGNDDGEVVMQIFPSFPMDDFKNSVFNFLRSQLPAMLRLISPTALYDLNEDCTIELEDYKGEPMNVKVWQILCVLHFILGASLNHWTKEQLNEVIGYPFDPIVTESLKRLRDEGGKNAAKKYNEIFSIAFNSDVK